MLSWCWLPVPQKVWAEELEMILMVQVCTDLPTWCKTRHPQPGGSQRRLKKLGKKLQVALGDYSSLVHHTATTIRTNIKSRRTFSVSGLLCAAHLSIIETKESLLGWPGFFIFNSSSNSIIVLGFQLNGWVWMAQDQFNNILYVSLAASNHKWSPSQFILGIQSIFFRITMSQK